MKTTTHNSSTALSTLVPVTFVLPGDGRSGGVRVTVIMANLLLSRGYNIRIACPYPASSLRNNLSRLATLVSGAQRNAGFLREFTGKIERYSRLDDLSFAPDEVVIA